MGTRHRGFVARIAAPVDCFQDLGPKPHHQVLAAARQRRGEQAAGHIGEGRAGRIVSRERLRGIQRADQRARIEPVDHPAAQCFQLGFIRRLAHPPPALAVVQRRATCVHGAQQRGRVVSHRSEPAFLRGHAQQLLVDFFQLQPIGRVFTVFNSLVLQRADLRQKFAGGAQLIGHMVRAAVVVAGNQPPQHVVAAQRHRQASRHTHVLQVFGVHHRHAAQRAKRHVHRLASVGVDQRHHFGQRAVDVGHRANPRLGKNIACRFRNVLGRVMHAQPGRQIALTAFCKNLTVVIGVKLIDHHAVEAGQQADLIGKCLAKRLHSAHGLQPGYRFFDDRVVVGLMTRTRRQGTGAVARLASARGLELQHHHAVDRVQRHIHRGDLLARGQREGINRVAVGWLGGQDAAQPDFTLHVDYHSYGLAEQRWRRLAEDGVGVFTRLQDRQI